MFWTINHPDDFEVHAEEYEEMERIRQEFNEADYPTDEEMEFQYSWAVANGLAE